MFNQPMPVNAFPACGKLRFFLIRFLTILKCFIEQRGYPIVQFHFFKPSMLTFRDVFGFVCI